MPGGISQTAKSPMSKPKRNEGDGRMGIASIRSQFVQQSNREYTLYVWVSPEYRDTARWVASSICAAMLSDLKMYVVPVVLEEETKQ